MGHFPSEEEVQAVVDVGFAIGGDAEHAFFILLQAAAWASVHISGVPVGESALDELRKKPLTRGVAELIGQVIDQTNMTEIGDRSWGLCAKWLLPANESYKLQLMRSKLWGEL